MSTRAQQLLEALDADSMTLHLRANHHHGVRCLECGRMLGRVHKLPSIRTCPNGECGTKYHISRSQRGLGVRRL